MIDLSSKLVKESSSRVQPTDDGSVILRYGAQAFPLRFDPQQLTILKPQDAAAQEVSDEAIVALLDNPTHGPGLSEVVHSHDQVVIVVPDATRAAGANRVTPLLVDYLNRCGISDKQISVLIGGGIHRPPTVAEIHSIVGSDVSRRLAVYPHDANDEAMLVSLGRTTRGTPVALNRRLVEADHVIVIGAISFHYIAGFSGGRKAILPGCAAERSIKANHLLSFDLESLNKREGIASASLDGNIVHQDMLEAVTMLGPSFLVNTVLNSENEIVSVYTGHWRDAHRQGCDEYALSHTVSVNERRPLVITSVGGAPRDINLIQSHKAMEHAAAVLEEGGTLIVLAECANGLGRDDFLDWFPPGGSRATVLKLVENYKINGQTAWGLRRKAERFRILLVSALEDSVVRQMGLEPVPSLEAALATAGEKSGYIVPYGLTTLPLVR